MEDKIKRIDNGYEDLSKDINHFLRTKDSSVKKKALSIFISIESTLGVTPEEIRRPTKGRLTIVYARHMAVYLLHQWLKLSYQKSGILAGRTNHSTAIHSVKIHKDMMEQDETYIDMYKTVIEHYQEETVSLRKKPISNKTNRIIALETKIDSTIRALQDIKGELILSL